MTPSGHEAVLQQPDPILNITFHGYRDHMRQDEEASIFSKLREQVQSIPDKAFSAGVRARTAYDINTRNFGEFAGAVKDEMVHGDKRIRSIGSFGITGLIWGAGVVKFPSAILIPKVSMEVLEHTGSSVASGAATTAVYGAWALASSRSWSGSIENFPDAVEVVADAYPKSVSGLSESLPCLHEDPGTKVQESSRAKRSGNWILTHTKRGVSSYSVGSMPYMVTSGLEGKDSDERAKLGNKLSADGAAVVGAITLGVSQLIVEVDKASPDVAEFMQDRIGSVWTWYGIAGLMILREFAKNNRSNKSE